VEDLRSETLDGFLGPFYWLVGGVDDASTAPPMKLRILSYNIHKCIGGVDRRYRPERVGEAIVHYAPDLILLQEVEQGTRRSNGHRQAELLGDLLGFQHRTWFPNVKFRDGGEYGNAILSRWPLVSSSNIDLTVGKRKQRSVLHAEIRIRQDEADRLVHVFNMHLGLSQLERRTQLGTFLQCHPFAGLHHDTPVIVAGDLNDVYGRLGRLLMPSGFRGSERPPRTFPAWAPLRALDSIYVRGAVRLLGVHRGETDLARRASDHRPLFADVVLGPSDAATT
jgi:endonuclease/exonuclease/phosphatase family metal-dependent hydrolase